MTNSSLPLVAVGSLGGTVTMERERGSPGLIPSLGAEDLVAAVPTATAVADLRATTLGRSAGASLSFETVLNALTWARAEVADGADGVVLLQGTDTIEEVAYLLDLLWDRSEPLVVTGAMRGPSHPGSDGPANLLASIVVAASPLVRDQGVTVVMNDEVHAASRVRKVDSIAAHAFTSHPFGPLGRIAENHLVLAGRRSRTPPLQVPVVTSVQIELIEMTLGNSGRLISSAVSHGADGLVIAGFGAGHVPVDALDRISAAVDMVPVVLASRAGSGPVLRHTYAFAGSEVDLHRRGVISAGWLDPRKARVLLWAAIANSMAEAEIRSLFDQRSEVG
ncbi:asparaginase [Jatrophihabitans telluris]|uniref:Asparaginase n=1 Tax=Jatrophihabitans telluris TaxID=2038343 RepID=A0ABY4QZ78_9ACTN|nr:asparaginase [Jatrophihabitans telluris]UQX88976.1 asparaginase [Jatrophihabitans telluris]